MLELLSDHEMYLTSFILRRIVESVTPVKAEKTDHRKEDSHTDTG